MLEQPNRNDASKPDASAAPTSMIHHRADDSVHQPAVVTPSKDFESPQQQAQQLCANTDEVLDSVDSCVGCVNQIGLQHDFEDTLGSVELPVEEFDPTTTLSEAEATLIRLQVAETEQDALPDMDLLNLCGGGGEVVSSPSATEGRHNTIEQDTSGTAKTTCAEVTVSSSDAEKQQQCAICDDTNTKLANLPCCKNRDESSVCVGCIQLLTYPVTETQRVGHCPCCRNWIIAQQHPQQQQQQVVVVVPPVQQQVCSVCNQEKDYMLVQDSKKVCDACFLGRRHPLEYECEACRVRQRIPHPMYRYQDSPDNFGRVTWACSEKKCGKFSHWRICADQIALIPAGDAPWGDPMDTARQFVQQLRRQQFLQQQQKAQQEEQCIIL